MTNVAARVAPGRRVKELARLVLPAPLWGALRLMRQGLVLGTFRPRNVRHRYAGFPLTVRISDPLAAGWYDADWDEPEEIALLRRHGLREGARVFDIGAHQGVVAMVLAKIVGGRGRVIAVEGSARNARLARTNAALNGLDHMVIVNAVAASSDAPIRFDRNLNGAVEAGSSGSERTKVRGLTLDSLARTYGQPDVLFVDVEGFECEVLEGGAKVLASRPDCFVEVHAGGHLQRYGGSVVRLARHFPPDDYELLVVPAGEGSTPTGNGRSAFVPCAAGIPLLEDRFFLLALNRRAGRGLHADRGAGLERSD